MDDSVRDRWYSHPGIWFWFVIVLGAALRFYLVVFTDGTQDVAIWERHARDVRENGLIGYYHGDPSANHPPFISEVESLFLRAADATGISFRIFLRAPFALIDAGTTVLLLLLLGTCRWRFVAAAVYWLNPLSIIFSAYHGNTDSAVAFLFAALRLAIVERQIALGFNCIGSEFVVQASNAARASGADLFHSGLAQALSISIDWRSCCVRELFAGLDSGSGDHLD